MNEWLRQELNEDIAPNGLEYTEEDIPDVMTCAGVLVNLICFNINVFWHTTFTKRTSTFKIIEGRRSDK